MTDVSMQAAISGFLLSIGGSLWVWTKLNAKKQLKKWLEAESKSKPSPSMSNPPPAERLPPPAALPAPAFPVGSSSGQIDQGWVLQRLGQLEQQRDELHRHTSARIEQLELQRDELAAKLSTNELQRHKLEWRVDDQREELARAVDENKRLTRLLEDSRDENLALRREIDATTTPRGTHGRRANAEADLGRARGDRGPAAVGVPERVAVRRETLGSETERRPPTPGGAGDPRRRGGD